MRRVTALVSAAAIVLSAVSVFAQARPDFSGKWTLDPASAPTGGGGGGRGGGRGGGGGWGMNPTITQTATTLTINYTAGQAGNPVQLVYNLDGSPSKNSQMGRGGEATETVSRATWSGSSLVITTTTGMGEQKRTLSLKDGNLVIEYNSGREGATPVTLTYKKG